MRLNISQNEADLVVKPARNSGLVDRIATRRPKREKIIPVFAWVSFLSFTWTLYHFAYNLPSWALNHSLIGILSILSYSMMFDLLEASLITLALVLVSMILPAGWMSRRFPAQSFLIVMTILALILSGHRERSGTLVEVLLVAAGVILNVLVIRVERFDRSLENLVSRFVAFLYIYIPLSAVGTIVALVRNLF